MEPVDQQNRPSQVCLLCSTIYIYTHVSYQLITHPYLANLGLCFNQMLGLAICLECSCAIGKKAIESHLHDVHKDHGFRIDHTKLKQAVVDLDIRESFDLDDLPPNCPPIEGLHLCPDAYLCAGCPHIRGTLLSIKRHHLTAHPNTPMPISWTRVAAQQLHAQNRTPYFQVTPDTVLSQHDDAATRFFMSLNKDRQKAVSDFNISKMDPRQVSTWLKVTQWHTLVAPYDRQHLVSLVVMPTKAESELEILAKAVHMYTRKADQVMDTLSHLALCIINSPEPP